MFRFLKTPPKGHLSAGPTESQYGPERMPLTKSEEQKMERASTLLFIVAEVEKERESATRGTVMANLHRHAQYEQ